MIGSIVGLIVGIGICVQAFNGELQVWSLGAVVIAVLIGFLFPVTIGTFLTGVAIASPIAAILGFVFGNASSGLAALGIGVLAFGGQFIIGLVRRDSSELGRY
jgi:hypothetical protein